MTFASDDYSTIASDVREPIPVATNAQRARAAEVRTHQPGIRVDDPLQQLPARPGGALAVVVEHRHPVGSLHLHGMMQHVAAQHRARTSVRDVDDDNGDKVSESLTITISCKTQPYQNKGYFKMAQILHLFEYVDATGKSNRE